jgi:hypothetical protein
MNVTDLCNEYERLLEMIDHKEIDWRTAKERNKALAGILKARQDELAYWRARGQVPNTSFYNDAKSRIDPGVERH